MAWIESHQSLGKHPKLLRLAGNLRIHKAQAIGHLKYLWWWALDYAPKGNLSAFASAEISTASEWSGDVELFVKALKVTGWLDKDGYIHDWHQYAGPCLASRRRQRKYRRGKKLRNGDITVIATEQNSTRPTVHNRTSKQLDMSDADICDVGKTEALVSELVLYCGDGSTPANFHALIKEHGEGKVREAYGELKMRVNCGKDIGCRPAYFTTLLKQWAKP